MLVKAVQDRKN